MIRKKPAPVPATNQDIKLLMEMMGKYFDETRSLIKKEVSHAVSASEDRMKKEISASITASEDRMKKEISASEGRMKKEISASVLEEIKLYMDIKFDDLKDAKNDRVAAHQDTIHNHRKRIERLEAHAGFATA